MGRSQFTALARTEESEATVKVASADSNSDVNATVIEVASGSGYLKSVQQLITPYRYGTQKGFITITIDGVALSEMELVRIVFAGAYPGKLVGAQNVFFNPSKRYEASLLVEHRRTREVAGNPTLTTVVTYTEE